jgi:hypothetical protein
VPLPLPLPGPLLVDVGAGGAPTETVVPLVGAKPELPPVGLAVVLTLEVVVVLFLETTSLVMLVVVDGWLVLEGLVDVDVAGGGVCDTSLPGML